jgi:hypothetical protein
MATQVQTRPLPRRAVLKVAFVTVHTNARLEKFHTFFRFVLYVFLIVGLEFGLPVRETAVLSKPAVAFHKVATKDGLVFGLGR